MDKRDSEVYTLAQVSGELGASRWVVRRLCRNGLVPHVKRNRVGRQVFTGEQVALMKVLIGLEAAGMTRQNLKRLVGLMRQGDATLAEQKALLETQRRQFWLELEKCRNGIDIVERNIDIIDQKLAGK